MRKPSHIYIISKAETLEKTKLDEKYQNDSDYEVKMQIINGGYQYSSDDNLYGKMKEIERDYDDIHPGEDKQLVFRSWDNVG